MASSSKEGESCCLDPGPERPSAETLIDKKSASDADAVNGSHVDDARVEDKQAPALSVDANGKEGGDEVVNGGSEVKEDNLVVGESAGNGDSAPEGDKVVKDGLLMDAEMKESKETGDGEKEGDAGSGDSVEDKENRANEFADGDLEFVDCEPVFEKCEGTNVLVEEKQESLVVKCEGENVLVEEKQDSAVKKCEGEDVVVEEKQKSSVEKCEGEDVVVEEKKELDKGEEVDATETDETVFSFNDLVWGKIKSHPWWPGQIFDPKYASEKAVKCRKNGHFLVAYFGDKTFAWCNESQLKSFKENFLQMEKQSSMVSFRNAVSSVLKEFSRRVELGLASKFPAGETYDDLKNQKVENAGIQEGTCNSAVDCSLFVNSFEPENFLEFIWTFALCPYGEIDRLELVTVIAQMKTFYRSKGHPQLPVYVLDGVLLEDDAEKSDADVSPPAASDSKSQKRLRAKTLKNTVPKNADVAKTGSKAKTLTGASAKKKLAINPDYSDLGGSKKRRLDKKLDTGGETPSSSRRNLTKVGDRVSRVASAMKKETGAKNELEKKSVTKRTIGRKAIADESKATTVKEVIALISADEMLSRLCLLATDPMRGHTSLLPPITFFGDYKNYCSSQHRSLSDSDDVEEPVKLSGRKVGGKNKQDAGPASPKASDPDFIQDSYWSDIIFHSSPERDPAPSSHKRKRASQKKGQKKKTKTRADALSEQVDASNPNDDQGAEVETSVDNSDEKAEEDTSTTLILSFDKPDNVPPAEELIRIFSPFGPLKEEQTEVLKKTARGKVVFKHQKDAENAFSSAGKYSAFGSALVSYRLRFNNQLPKSSLATSPQEGNDAMGSRDTT